MNLCKSGIIGARTKSLREKFSRNRSYSELSFKDTTSSLLSTPTESCAGSLAGTSGGTGSVTPGATSSPLRRQAHQQAVEYFQNESYCSALDLSTQPLVDAPRFPWQRDAATQCDLIKAPVLVWPPPHKKSKDNAGSKKKISSSSTSSAASTLINAAAATLRMTGITDNSNSPSNSRFWKSSLLLPNLNVSGIDSELNDVDENECNLRRQKSYKWSSPSMVRRPALKRAASFDSRSGYARLVQSTSSPSSPPDTQPCNLVDLEPPRSALPVLESKQLDSYSSNKKDAHSFGSQQSHSKSSNSFFNWTSSISRPTALLGASAAMTAAAPFTGATGLMSPKLAMPHETASHSSGSPIVHRKMSSREMSMKELRRKQFLVSRKQPSSAPESFDEDSIHSPSKDKSHNVSNLPSLSGDSELYNYNTVHRLLNISLSASNATPDNVIKPFLLDLPDVHSACHLNLPSPNVQSEIQEVNPVLRKLSVLSRAPHKALTSRLSDSTDKKKPTYYDYDDDLFDDDENEMLPDEPPVAALQRRSRRRALVPPKLITDGYESSTEFDDKQVEPNIGENSYRSNKSDSSKQSDGGNETLIDTDSSASEVAGQPPDSTLPESVPRSVTPNVTIHEIGEERLSKELGDEQSTGSGRKLPSPRGSARLSMGHSSTSSGSSGNTLGANLNRLDSNASRNQRRSSVVVIPPMQICPGDLLVYSKVLSQRSYMIGNEGSFSSALLNAQEQSRKSHKNTWSLLRLFDRSNSRNKAAADQILCGLEEVLSNLQPSNSFVDESMLRYRGISWNEFLARIEERRVSNASSFTSASSSLVTSASAAAAAAATATVGLGCSRFFHGARFSSLQSNALDVSTTGSNTSHVCKKISLPCSGINRTMQLNLERMKMKHEKSKTIDSPSNEASKTKIKLQRAESCSTVSDVESIIENYESPIKRDDDSTNEEMGGDKYDNDSICCSCSEIYKREQQRCEKLWNMFQHDLMFLTEHLMVMKNVYMEPLKNIQVEGYAMFAEPEVIFGNLDELCLVTYAFCREFLNILISQASSGDFNVISILAKLYQKSGRAAALTQAYHRYTLNYINALNYLETLRRQIEFTEFEKWCNRDTRCKKLQLTDLLVSPVQHVMRLPLLLKEIEEKTTDPSEKAVIKSILDEQKHSICELDDKINWLRNFERLLEIQRNIIWPSVIDLDPKVFVPEFLKSLLAKQPCERLVVSPRRQIILEGPLMVLDSGKPVEMYVFLFDDLLLITRRKKGLGKKQSTLTERWVSNCSGRNSSFSSVVSSGGATSTVSVATGSTSTVPSVTSAVINAATVTATSGTTMATGEPNFGPLPGGGAAVGCPVKYVVYKQPLSLDRFYIHDILPTTEGAANLKNCFVFVCLNRFQQVITVHTFQAASESAKNIWVNKIRDTCALWKRTLQSSTFRGGQGHSNGAQAQPGGNERSVSAFGNRLNLNSNLQPNKSQYGKNKSPPRQSGQLEVGLEPRKSSGSVSMSSSLRDNASCSYMIDDSIVITSTFT